MARIETDDLAYEIGENGKNVLFECKKKKRNYCAKSAGFFACIKKEGAYYNSSHVSQSGNIINIIFGDSGVKAVLKAVTHKNYFILEVVSVSSEDVQEFVFCDIQLTLKGSLDESFAACALALNLETDVTEIPGPAGRLKAVCYKRFGFAGARVAVIGCPQDKLRGIMKKIVQSCDELPHSPLGGPWALDAGINRGAYLFNFGGLTEETADDWIKLAKSLGFTQINFHGGGSFRFGDFRPDPKTYPQGKKSLKAAIDKLHSAGIKAGLHTYAFFMDKTCPWVTPVPDTRLGWNAVFTLNSDISCEDSVIKIEESASRASAITGWCVRNSNTLRVDNELITFSGVSKEAPYVFTGCSRGACGTKISTHKKGDKAYQLKECFGLFAPDGDSTLFEEIAQKTADTFNECGFDMIYLDALDGEDIFAGQENAWHYGSKFVFEVWKRLNKPALMEMSTFHHHLWFVRSRTGAWDYSHREHKRFVDKHCRHNEGNKRLLLPVHLGWWGIQTWTSAQKEPTYSDDIEYLCSKALAADASLSLIGIEPKNFTGNAYLQKLSGIFREYELLKRKRYFSETVIKKVKAPGKEFTLVKTKNKKWQFQSIEYSKHKIEEGGRAGDHFGITNNFKRQALQVRIETLMSAQPYDAPGNTVLADTSDTQVFSCKANNGVKADLGISEISKNGWKSMCYAAFNSNAKRKDGWSKMEKVFSPILSFKECIGIGVWVHGDGNGETLNFQPANSRHIFGLPDNHHIVINFKGWRYFELIEPDRLNDRDLTNFAYLEFFSMCYNDLPLKKKVSCCVSPVKALSLVKAEIIDPSITINGKTISFPVKIESGSYLEFYSASDCRLYGPNGVLISKVRPLGDAPMLCKGRNRAAFSHKSAAGVNKRAQITVITRGNIVR